MKYKTGDKFVIEIESRINSQGLYKIKKFDALVFDDKGLDRLEHVHEHDEDAPCSRCKYEYVPYGQEPCGICKHYCESMYVPKEIQVGDEVELWGEQGVVVKSGRFLTVLDSEFDAHVWNPDDCKRTGKTYPELIKALESLPKE